ncbi:hypothetical protein U0070_002807, partial [Myodes glareolus]
SKGKILLTQSAESLHISPGERVSITCRASQSLLYTDGKHYLSWYQQYKGQTIKAFIYHASVRIDVVPTRFIGSGSGTECTLTIEDLQPEDCSTGDIVLTQSPGLLTALGQKATISCKSSESVTVVGSYHRMHWYQQKPGQPPKLLIY